MKLTTRFRKQVKVGPGKLNIGKTGLNSASIKVGPVNLNVGLKGKRAGKPKVSINIPGTGISFDLNL